MTTEIIKRISYASLISLAISMFFSWANYQATTGNEQKQGVFALVLVNFGFCILNFILALPAFLNLNQNVRDNLATSFLSFIGLPLCLLIALISLFATSKNEHETIKDFFLLGLPSITFCLAISYHFYLFRQTPEVTGKTS